MHEPSLIAMSGSARAGSLNRQVLGAMAHGAQEAGSRITFVELRDYPLPIYDGDLEVNEGLPAAAADLQSLFAANQGLLLASPEYNGYFTPLLKNTLDWVSRPLADGSDRSGTMLFQRMVAGIASASPGRLGGVRSLQHTRLYLANLGFLVVPGQVGVADAAGALSDTGELVDEELRAEVREIGAAVARLAAELHG
jgi:chromate reductase, NAD(P)H dehydrogenase (quinone)